MTNQTKHTPGPWHIGTPGPNGCYTIGTTDCLMTVAIAHSINEPDQKQQAVANAHLVAAAPELLDAANFALSVLSLEDSNDQIRLEAAGHLQAAIAKAEVRT